MRRLDVRAILANPVLRRRLMAWTIQATQARENIKTTQQQAEDAYDKIQLEKNNAPVAEWYTQQT